MEEEELRTQLEALFAEINAPTQLKVIYLALLRPVHTNTIQHLIQFSTKLAQFSVDHQNIQNTVASHILLKSGCFE